MRVVNASILAAVVMASPLLADTTVTVGGKNYFFKDVTYMGLPGELYVPSAYNGTTALPLITFLHGLGEGGTNNTSQLNGNMQNLIVNAEAKNCFLFAPQTPSSTWWGSIIDSGIVNKSIGNISQNYKIDPTRLYLTGLSSGGQGSMNTLRNTPTLFAGYVPLSVASGDFGSTTDAAPSVGRPTWYFTGSTDSAIAPTQRSFSYQMQAAGYAAPSFPSGAASYPLTENGLNYFTNASANGLYHYTEFYNTGHTATTWNTGAYNDQGMYTWLMSQHNTVSSVGATPVRLQLGGTGSTSSVLTASRKDSSNRVWNVIDGYQAQATPGMLITNAMDQNGNRTTAIFELSKAFYAMHNVTTLPAGAPYDDAVAANYWRLYTYNTNSGEIKVHGLTLGQAYNLDLFASVSTTAGDTNYRGIYSVGAQSININAANNTSIYSLTGLLPDATGSLTLDVNIVSGSNYAILNTLDVVAVPEPTAMVSLLGIAGFAALRRRRAC